MSTFLPVDSITVPEERQRNEIPEDHLAELASSITSPIGLLQAIVVQDDGKTLVAGECRLTAVRRIYAEGGTFTHNGESVPSGHIPATRLCDLSPDLVYEAELEENIRRRELPWQRKAYAIANLERIRRAQAEAAGRPFTQREFTKEVLGISVEASGSARDSVKQLSELAAHLDDPEVAKAKSEKEAAKIVAKKKAVEHRKKLAEEFALGEGAKRFPHTLLQGRMEELFPTLEDGQFAGIICDPPYGVDADKFSAQGGDHKYEDTEEYALSLYTLIAREGARVCQLDAHLYAFCDIGLFYKIRDIFATSGWTPWYRPLLWFKGNNNGVLPAPDYGPRNTYEAILYCRRGGRKTRCVGPDVLSVPPVSRLTFGAQKPVALYRELLSRSFDPGDKVLDPSCGAGGIFRAAQALNVVATGFELNPEKIDYIHATYDEAETPEDLV